MRFQAAGGDLPAIQSGLWAEHTEPINIHLNLPAAAAATVVQSHRCSGVCFPSSARLLI